MNGFSVDFSKYLINNLVSMELIHQLNIYPVSVNVISLIN